MKRRTLGRTGLQISELGLGGLFVSQHGAALEQGKATIRHALQSGINSIDTASAYLDSEAVIGQAIEGITTTGDGEPIIVSTKLGRRVVDGKAQPFDPKDKTQLR